MKLPSSSILFVAIAVAAIGIRSVAGIPEEKAQVFYEFPVVDTDEFVHGLCVMGLTSNDEASATSTDPDLTYEAISGFSEGFQLFGNRDYLSSGTSGEASHCEGGMYLQPSLVKETKRGTKITGSLLFGESYSVTCCIFVEADHNPVRDGRWPEQLEESWVLQETKFQWTNGGSFTENMVAYCRDFDGTSDEDYRRGTIDRYEIYQVGEDGGKPFGAITSLEPLVGYVYFEAHPEQLSGKGAMTIELFSEVPDGLPCDKGTLLESTADYEIDADSFPFDGYNDLFDDVESTVRFPRTRNGVVGAVEFLISDFVAPETIYFPDRGDPEADGEISFCVRTSIKEDYNQDGIEDYISFLETHFKIEVDLSANFATFGDQPVEIYSRDARTVEQEAVVEIEVESFLCGFPCEACERDTYAIGQDFQVCVSPTPEYLSRYKISGFESVVCENDSEYRIMIMDNNPAPLTTIIGDVAGSQDFSGTKTAGENAMAFRSVVTAGFLEDGLSSFKCYGAVELEYGDYEFCEETYTFPTTDYEPHTYPQGQPSTGGMVHGLCVLDASVATAYGSDGYEYESLYDFGDGMQFFGDSGDKWISLGIDGNGREVCEGGIFLQSSDKFGPPSGIDVTIEATPLDPEEGVTICAFLEHPFEHPSGTFDRVGNWKEILVNEQGFEESGTQFSFNPDYPDIMNAYCKTVQLCPSRRRTQTLEFTHSFLRSKEVPLSSSDGRGLQERPEKSRFSSIVLISAAPAGLSRWNVLSMVSLMFVATTSMVL